MRLTVKKALGWGGLLLAGGGVSAGSVDPASQVSRPNFLIILLDDFGTGCFAPQAQGLSTNSFDPAFVRFLQTRPGGNYSGEEALDAARKAMPTMSRLAADGILFEQAYSADALCAPSRCGLATGMNPARFGLYQNPDVNAPPGALPGDRILARFFQAAGYATGHVGKWHIGPLDEEMGKAVLQKYGLPEKTSFEGLSKTSAAYKELVANSFYGSVPAKLHPLNNGFDYYYGYNYHETKLYDMDNIWENSKPAGVQHGYNREIFTQKAIGFIDSAVASGKPFLLNLHHQAMHSPVDPEAPARYLSRFEGFSPVLRNYYAHLFAADESIRAVMEELDRLHVLKNTCVIFTADNGCPLSNEKYPLPGNAPNRGHKGQYLLGGIHVPFVIYWPNRIQKGRRTSELVSLLDVMPTAMDAAGMKLPADLDGRSLLPMIDGAEKGPHDYLTWFGLESRTWGFMRDTAGSKWLRIRDKEPGSWTVMSDEWVLRFTGKIEKGMYNDFPDGKQSGMELYSMKNDPGETRDLHTQYPEVVTELKSVAAKQMTGLPPPAHWSREKWEELG